jgi:hypothetical protein
VFTAKRGKTKGKNKKTSTTTAQRLCNDARLSMELLLEGFWSKSVHEANGPM